MQSPFLIVPLLSAAAPAEPTFAPPLANPTVTAQRGNRHEGRPFPPLDEVRSIDGTGNHEVDVERGATHIPFRRLTSSAYTDGVDSPSGARLPSARFISNGVFTQPGDVPNQAGLSDMFWQWGQFLDHDITETPVHDPAEPFPIPVPRGDLWFDPLGTGTQEIPLSRSFPVYPNGVREQINGITAWIDGSQVYGSDAERADALRTLDGTGMLKTSDGDLMPFNVDGLPNAPSSALPEFFLGGDIRANEQVGLTALHVLFVREHNYWARRIAEEDEEWRDSRHGGGPGGGPGGGNGGGRTLSDDAYRGSKAPPLTGDQIYELSRAIVSAELQIITYREWLPLLLGQGAPRLDSTYRPELDGSISNEFATAAFRIGHTMLSTTLLRLDRDGNTIPEGDLSLSDAFFSPAETIATGIDPVLRGLVTQHAQNLDLYLIDDIRNLLFGPPGSGGLDLGSLNLQRARDHGLPTYAQARRDLGLGAPSNFAQMSTDPEVLARLNSTVRSPETLDLWVGGLAEDPLPGSLVGELFQTILREQFIGLRDGDRLWYSRQLPRELAELAEEQSLSRILARNSGLRPPFIQTPFQAE